MISACARPDDQVERCADVERVDLPAFGKRVRDLVEIRGRISATHAATVQAQDAEWQQNSGHRPR